MDRTSMNLFERSNLQEWSTTGGSGKRVEAATKFEKAFLLDRVIVKYGDEGFEDVMERGDISKSGINQLFHLTTEEAGETYFRDRDSGNIVIVEDMEDYIVVCQAVEDQELLGWLLLFCQPKGDGLGLRSVLEHISDAEGRSMRGGNDSVLLAGTYPKELTELLLDISNVDMDWEGSAMMPVEELPEGDGTYIERYMDLKGLKESKHLFSYSQNRFDINLYMIDGDLYTSDEVMVGSSGVGVADFLRYILLGYLVSFDVSGDLKREVGEYWV